MYSLRSINRVPTVFGYKLHTPYIPPKTAEVRYVSVCMYMVHMYKYVLYNVQIHICNFQMFPRGFLGNLAY